MQSRKAQTLKTRLFTVATLVCAGIATVPMDANAVTITPTLTKPLAGVTYVSGPSNMPIRFTLAEDYSVLSVKWELESAAADNFRIITMKLGLPLTTQLAEFDPLGSNESILAATGVSAQIASISTKINGLTGTGALPEGLYTVTLSYSNLAADPSATAQVLHVNLVRPCQLGSHSATGHSPCTSASPGTYVAITGSTSAVDCPDGTFQPNYGSMMCLIASAGHYSAADHTDEYPCRSGTYQPDEGMTSCRVADPGYFVALMGAISQSLCPAGTTSAAGAFECTAIPPAVTTTTTAPATTTTTTIPAPSNTSASAATTTTTLATAATTSAPLRRPTIPKVASKVGVNRSFMVIARNQANIAGLKMSMTTKSKTCRVTKTTKGFSVSGLKKGTCTLSVRVTGNSVYESVSLTTRVAVT